MDREKTERRTYPRYSRNSRRGAEDVVALDYSTTRENVDTGDSGETTQDANRFADVGSAQPPGETAVMPTAKEITRAVFSSWVERRLQILKEWREQSQNTVDDRETSPATPLTSKERRQAHQTRRRAK